MTFYLDNEVNIEIDSLEIYEYLNILRGNFIMAKAAIVTNVTLTSAPLSANGKGPIKDSVHIKNDYFVKIKTAHLKYKHNICILFYKGNTFCLHLWISKRHIG